MFLRRGALRWRCGRILHNVQMLSPRHRGVTPFAAILLAVGIGSATAMFSIVNAVWLRPLPMAGADRLFTISTQNPRRNIVDGPFSWAAYQALDTSRVPQIAGLIAFASDRFTVTGVDDPELLAGGRVSAAFFDILGVRLAAGRGFLPEEDQPGGPASVVLGRELWTRRFGGDPAIVGRTVTLDGLPRLVVGVLGVDLPPPLAGVDVWTTRVWEVSSLTAAQIASGAGYLGAVARLAPGADAAAAQAAVDTLHHAYATSHPGNTDADPDATLRLTPFARQMLGTAAEPLALLSGAVALVVLIACANVAGLLLIRAMERRNEWMIRVALGATRGRLLRQMAGEALLLGAAAGAGGLVLAWWALRLGATAIAGLPRGADASFGTASAMFAVLAAMATALAATLIPAWRAASAADGGHLRAGSRAIARGGRSGGLLVTCEVTLAVLLIIGAGLMLQSLSRLLKVPLGYDPAGVVTMRISLPPSRYPALPEMGALVTRLIERTRTVPGVAGAAASVAVPPIGTLFGPYQDAAEAPKPVGERALAQWSCITPDYFRTLRIPILQGRAFTDRDAAGTPRVTIISRSLAAKLWPGRDPIGQRLFVARLAEPSTVVGVAGDVRNAGLDREPNDQMYSPYVQRTWASFVLTARTAGGDPMRLVPGIRTALRDIDPDLAPTAVTSGEAALGDASAQVRFTAVIMAAFGAVALMMAAAGLYGVVAYSVSQRTREIGVRVALGAQRSQVLALVVGHAARLAIVGILAGSGTALAAGRLFESVLYGTSAHDPLVFASVAGLFMAIALAASAVPARRALRVNPIVALRDN